MISVRTFVLLFSLFAFAGCGNADTSIQSMDDYHAAIDYSCDRDEDCVIKDVHNCCGYYPSCVNSEAVVSPETVGRLCAEEGMAGICGFPAIKSCRCNDNICEGSSSSAPFDGPEVE